MSVDRRLRAASSAGLVLTLLVACQGAPSGSPTAASAGATQGHLATPSGVSPSTTPLPIVSTGPSPFTIEFAAEPFIRAADGPEGSLYALPAAATRAQDGTLVLAIAWFGQDATPPSITISTSTDGSAWDVGTENVLESLDIGFENPGPIPSAIVELEDGAWHLYGWASANASGTEFLSWRASAAAPDGPWVLDSDELLGAGPAGDWDSYMVGPGSVLRTEDGYAMWYEGEPPGSSNRGDIGLATSPDGLAWTKLDDPATTAAPFAASDPVIGTGLCGASTSVAVEQPQVERVGDGYVAFYGGFGATSEMFGVFGALSDDGRAWRCASTQPLFDGSVLGGGGIHTMTSIPLEDERIGLIVESIVNDHSDLWWATVTMAGE